MDLVDIERVFGGERMVIYYLSEDRVDYQGTGKATCARVPDTCRDETDRRSRRSQTAGRLWRLWQTRLLQQFSDEDSAGLDEDGKAAKGDA